MMIKKIQPLIANLNATRHILKTFNLRASKRLGQNFLIDKSVVDEIVNAAEIEAGEKILEIGPGIGTLTQGLLEADANVTAVELDKKLPAVLAETLAGYENFSLIQGDILKVDIREIMNGQSFKVVANLPYYITTQIILTLLEKKLPIKKIVTMVQREVAERIIATPENLIAAKESAKTYGALSVAVQFYTEPKIAFDVSPTAFLPSPEVTSSVIICEVRESPAVEVVDEKFFFRVVRAAFSQRRKTVVNSLIGGGFNREKVISALQQSNIDIKLRAENLSINDFATFSNNLRGDQLA
ncbi:MAG: 16S rRNA (adenine(1518)-N(6)/adenine(1519)-N(6))-dimethyltransferase RsmA [Selenomonadaceae bacterium]|nr:16S rRNA (adenine(1518)-N(6)/adenine(1519)-N(6))-dimethyltransferase RsmA [Selenomonadaceae bacterium]